MLLLIEAVGIRAVGRIDGLGQKVGKILVEAGFCRTRLSDYVSSDVPRLLDGKLRIQLVHAVRHLKCTKFAAVISRAMPAPLLKLSGRPQRRPPLSAVPG